MTREELLALIEEEKQKILQEQLDPEKVRDHYRTLVEQNLQQQLLHFMGFKKQGWSADIIEIDHCNGRKGFIDQFMEQHARQHSSQFLSVVEAELSKITPSKQVINYCKKIYKERLEEKLQEKAFSLADEHAGQLIQSILSDLSRDTDHDKEVAALQRAISTCTDDATRTLLKERLGVIRTQLIQAASVE